MRKVMNKSIFIPIIFITLCGILLAQKPVTELHAGILMPSGAQNGFIGGISMGRAIDDNLTWAVEADYYVKTYTEETEVPGGGSGSVDEDLIITKIENSTRMLPVLFKLAYTTPLSPSLDVRFSGGLGYEFMWNTEINHEENIDQTRHYNGFAWFIGGGVSLPISRAADLFIEANYHSGNPSRGEGTNEAGLPVRTEVDMSGAMIRAGIKIFNFGFL
jgi:hypothetical protein